MAWSPSRTSAAASIRAACGAFNNHNTDTYGITLNLRTDRVREILTENIHQSDAVTRNCAAGVLARCGAGASTLSV